MAKYTRKRVALAKVESTYGTDASPTGAANAIQISAPTITPLAGGTVKRDLVRDALGADPAIHVGSHVLVGFGVEIAGAGAAGTAPAYGALLRGCAMAETAVTDVATIQDSPPTGVGGPTGTFTYTKTTKSSGLVKRTVTLTCTTGGGSGVAAFTVAAPATVFDAAYNQTAVVMTDASAFALPNGAEITPTVGTDFVTNDVFTIDLTPERVDYDPVSASEESVTIYFNVDGTRHALLGARGNVTLSFPPNDIPRYQFAFTGLWADPSETAAPTPDFSSFLTPLAVSKTNTSAFTLHGFSAVLEELSLNLGNVIEHRDRVNSEAVLRTDRQGDGQVSFEAPPVSTKNFFTIAKANTLGALQVIHGTATGNIVQIDAPKAQILEPGYGDSQGLTLIQANLLTAPDAGDDDIKISVK